MTRILLVEDSRSFSRMAAHALESRAGLEVVTASSLAEAGKVLDRDSSGTLVVTGLSLADARGTEAVEYFTRRHLPVVVLTAAFDPELRSRILEMPVSDYLLKDGGPACLDNLVALATRLHGNAATTALVVDDSASMRQRLAALLALHRFTVLEAEDGHSGLELVQSRPEIRLVVTDFDMPRMDGIEMVQRIRQTHPREELAIIGLSSSTSAPQGRGTLSARFIKSGANDFLPKPFEREEFHCRVTQNMDALDAFARLRDMATKDFLTGLSNRRHFFAQAARLLERESSRHIAMIDVDHFKHINDHFGHDLGDQVLRQVAATLTASLRPGDLLARFGGEEFCILAEAPPSGYFDSLRTAIAATQVEVREEPVPVTVSIGVAPLVDGILKDALSAADMALYRAKAEGRNRVAFA